MEGRQAGRGTKGDKVRQRSPAKGHRTAHYATFAPWGSNRNSHKQQGIARACSSLGWIWRALIDCNTEPGKENVKESNYAQQRATARVTAAPPTGELRDHHIFG
ncbi:MAG: hypothetical protein ACRC8B_07460 [Aeromonas sobria]|uniref:hypothetical protein n=1 Tax=Aeromonas sobria TaxID=646 RepID=UPI003F3F2129